jgi:hypothetical protein
MFVQLVKFRTQGSVQICQKIETIGGTVNLYPYNKSNYTKIAKNLTSFNVSLSY